jgi:tRNA G18 (ribose-2'-O)-methylase SpoU
MRKLRTTELNRLDVDEFKSAPKTPVVIVLDNVRSLLNVGSVFRTSDAFRFSKIFLCGITPTPSLEMNKTALGAIDSVEWEYCKDVITALRGLRADGYSIYGIEQTDSSVKLDAIKSFPEKVAVVLGNEVKGVSMEALDMCNEIVEIPQQGTKHSLNVSVCGGIISWELYKHLGVK